jgi:hypothetical protein
MAAISRAFAPPPRLFRTKPPPAFDEDDERGLPPDADDDDAAAHAVIAEHTAHRTNCADGGCTNTVPHPRCCGVPAHVILGMIKACSLSFFNCGFGRKTFVSRENLVVEKAVFENNTTTTTTAGRKRAKEKGKTSREKNMPAANASASRVTRSSAANKTRGAGGKRDQSRPPIINPEDEDEDKGDDDVDSEDSDSDDAPPEEVTRAVAEKETREEQLLKKRARETQQLAKEREKEKRVEKAKARTEAAAKRKREKEEKRKAEEEEEGKENEREEEEEEEEGAEEDPDAFTLDDDIVDAVAASENQLKEKYLKDFHDTKSQRKKRKKQMKRERMREEAMGRESAKFTTRDGFDVVIRSKVDELAEMKANPKAVDFARRRLDAKHRRDERMLCDTRTGKIKNQFAVR